MTRMHFDKELEELNQSLIKMAAMVENSIEFTIDALIKQDTDIAEDIIKNDSLIDTHERMIEKECLKLLATQQPIAGDLRTIGTILKMITDLERIADHAADIAEITIRNSEEDYIKPLVDIPKMAEEAKKMVSKAIDSFINKDIEAAKQVCKKDDKVDDYFYKIIIELIGLMKESPEIIEQAIDLMFIAKYLERIGDHATNIAEWVVYNETGEHDHLASIFKKKKKRKNEILFNQLHRTDTDIKDV
jgi:phosphate transport system protein